MFFYLGLVPDYMELSQIIAYVKYGSIFTIGMILGRLSMAIQYAIMKPKK